MGLSLQPTRRLGGKIATLIAVFALVMQPMYGLVTERIANAAANTAYTATSFSDLPRTDLRLAPTGVNEVMPNTLTIGVDGTKKHSSSHYRFEGIALDVPAGTTSARASLHIDESWRDVSGFSVEMWAKVRTNHTSYPEMWPAIFVNNYSTDAVSIQAWSPATGAVSAPVYANYNSSVSLEIESDPTTGELAYYVNNTEVFRHGYGSYQFGAVEQVIFTNENPGGGEINNYQATWSNLELGTKVLTAPSELASTARSGSDITNGATSVNYVRNSWSAVSGAVSYNYEFKKPNDLPTFSRNQTATFVQGQFHDSNSPEGQYAFRVQAVFASGAVSQWSEWSNVAYDKTSPAAPVITNSPLYVGLNHPTGVPATWSHDGQDVAYYEYREYRSEAQANSDVNGTDTSSNIWIPNRTNTDANNRSQAVGHSWTSNVNLYYRIVAVDKAGNRSVPSAVGVAYVDKTVPVVHIDSATQLNSNRVEFSGYVFDTNFEHYYCLLTGSDGREISGTRDANCITTWARDLQRNGNPATPDVTGAGSADNPVVLGGFDISGLTSGQYYVNIVGVDRAKNRSETASYPITIDKTAPVVTIDNDRDSYNNTRTPLITGTVGGDATAVEVSINGGEWVAANYTAGESTWSYQIPASPALVNGPHTVLARAVDELGNVGNAEDGTLATAGFIIEVTQQERITTTDTTDENANNDEGASSNPVNIFAQNLQFLPLGNAVVGADTDADDTDGDVASAIDMRDENGDVLSAQDDRDQWSIINLLLSIVVAALSVIALFGLAGKDKENRNTLTRVLTIVPVLGAGAVLLFAEDFSGQMGWVNIWTLLVGALVVVQMILLANTKVDAE